MSLSQRIAAEERLARRVGVRKHDLLLLRLTCPDCAHPLSREERLMGTAPRTMDALEGWMVQRLLREPVGECARCATDRAGRWRRSAVLLRYCERRLAHLVLQLSLTPVTRPGTAPLLASSTVAGPPDETELSREDMRVRVSMHWKGLGDTLRAITVDDPALRCLAHDAVLRDALHMADPGRRLQTLRHLALRHPEDAAIPREIAYLLLEVGSYSVAEEAIERSLALDPRQPRLLRLSASLRRTRGELGPALDRCMEAWELAPEAEILPDLVTTALRAGRTNLARSAASDLLEEEGTEGTILAEATLALLEGARDPEAARQAWDTLVRSARRAGDSARQKVAEHATAFWSLPLPVWPEDEPAEAWRDRAVAHLGELGMSPPGNEAHPPQADFALRSADDTLWAICIVDEVPSPRMIRTTTARILALQAAPGGEARSIGIVGRTPLPWILHVLAAGGSDAGFLRALEEIMDPGLQAPERQVAALIREALHWYGETLDVCPANLTALSRIVERLRFRGLGSPTCGLQCAVAAWLGALLTKLAPEASWTQERSAEPSRPHFVLPGQAPVDLIAAVGHLFEAPFTFRLRHYVDALLQRPTHNPQQA